MWDSVVGICDRDLCFPVVGICVSHRINGGVYNGSQVCRTERLSGMDFKSSDT